LIAVDTNILIYAEDPDDPNGRHDKSAVLLEKLSTAPTIIPIQVLGEFLNVCRRKQVAPMDLAAAKVATYAAVFETPVTISQDLFDAMEISSSFGLQYFDALIVAVAQRAGANLLLSEDMHDGLEIEGLKIINPFAAANETLLADYFANAL
jgi:predicted nucleic acid-binding protein